MLRQWRDGKIANDKIETVLIEKRGQCNKKHRLSNSDITTLLYILYRNEDLHLKSTHMTTLLYTLQRDEAALGWLRFY